MKKFLTILLSIVMAIATCSLFACGEKEEPAPTPKDENEKTIEKEKVSDGFFKQKDDGKKFYIQNKDGLYNFAGYFAGHSMKDCTVYLESDITLTEDDEAWTGIQVKENNDNFTFDGQDKKIENLILKKSETKLINDTQPTGFFTTVVADNITVKNITFKTVSTIEGEDTKYGGVIVGYHYGKRLILNNIHVDGFTMIMGNKKNGGLIGFSRCAYWGAKPSTDAERVELANNTSGSTGNNTLYGLTVENCSIKNSSLSSASDVSFICGTVLLAKEYFAQNKLVIKNCKVENCVLTLTSANTYSMFIWDSDEIDDKEGETVTTPANAKVLEFNMALKMQNGCVSSGNTINGNAIA